MLPTHRPDLIARRIEGEVVVLDQEAGKVHQLNPTASRIWECCDGSASIADIAARVAEEFDVPAGTAHEDVVSALAEFERLGLLAK
jgi:PqqD family protein of HPr-rel-A system